MTTPNRRLFVLLAWHPVLGLTIDPVGVLATEETSAGLETAVSWVPRTYGTAWTWRQRLATTVTPEVLAHWREDQSTAQLTEIAPPPAPSLSHLAEGALDEVLTGSIWEEA